MLSKMAPRKTKRTVPPLPGSESPPGLVATTCLKTVSGHSRPKRRPGNLDREGPHRPLGVYSRAGVPRTVLYVFSRLTRTTPAKVSAVVIHGPHGKKSRSGEGERLVQGRRGEDLHPKVLT